MKRILLLSISLSIVSYSQAQSASGVPDIRVFGILNANTFLIIAIGSVIGISILALLVAIYALFTIKTILFKESDSGNISVKQEESLAEDAAVNGFQNNRPLYRSWLKWVLYPSIGIAATWLLIFNVFHLHPFQNKGESVIMSSNKNETKVIKASLNVPIDESNVEFSNDPATIDSGKVIFATNCLPCHGPDGGGLVGPNLTDRYWIHGGSIQDIFRTIKNGVPDKGMITWQQVLSPVKIRDVACFILTLQGTKPANPKAPQGELYVPGKNRGLIPDATAQNTIKNGEK